MGCRRVSCPVGTSAFPFGSLWLGRDITASTLLLSLEGNRHAQGVIQSKPTSKTGQVNCVRRRSSVKPSLAGSESTGVGRDSTGRAS